MSSKEKEIILKMLDLYREMPYLWDKQHKDYKNKDCRNEGNRVLLELYKNLEPDATLKTLVKKIQNLRTNYMKEYKKIKDSNRTGAGADDIYIPNLYYFDALSFLGACTEPCRTTKDTLETEDFSSDDTTQCETQSISSDVPKRKKKKMTKASLLEKQDKVMTKAEELLNATGKEEDWEVLGKSIGVQLRDLDKSKIRIVQKIISDAIYYASTGALTHNSFIALGPPVTRDLPYASPSTSSSYKHQEPNTYHGSYTPSPLPSPSPQRSLHSSRSSPSPQLISYNNSSHSNHYSAYTYHKMQTTRPLSSSYNQVQSPEAPPSPYDQMQSPEAPPSPYDQMQSPEAPLSRYQQMQPPAPPSHRHEHAQPFKHTQSSYDYLTSNDIETSQQVGANIEISTENFNNSISTEQSSEYNPQNFPNTSISTGGSTEPAAWKNVIVECKGSEINDFLIFRPKNK